MKKDVSTDILLTTKMHIPVPSRDLVSRTHLLERLNEGLHTRLTLISAPAGFGKTTLLSTWALDASSRLLPVGWISLDESDNDPARFWSYVLAALDAIHADISSDILSSPSSLENTLNESFLGKLVNILAAVPVTLALVLDDYHVITEPAISAGLTFLLDHLPPNMHLFIASRSDPALPLARLRGRNQLNELRTNDLRFSLAESADFLKRSPAPRLSSEQITTLEERTEGWVTGLQLVALALRGSKDSATFLASFSGTHRYIANYLFAEVFRQQSTSVQQFLLHTALLDRLTGSLCDALLERFDGQQVLEELERANLFLVSLDEQRYWYRYHQLLRDFLFDMLQRTHPTLLPTLYQRASVWCENKGLWHEAIDYALTAQDNARAAALIEQVINELSNRRELKTLRRWLEALPPVVLQNRPRLVLPYLWLLISIGQVESAEQILAHVEESPETVAELHTMRAIIASMRGDYKQITQLSTQAIEHLAEDVPMLRSLLALSQGTAHFLSGDGNAAEQSFAKAGELSLNDNNLYMTQVAKTQRASVYFIQGKLHLAFEEQRSALQLAERHPGQVLDMGLAHIGISGIYLEWNRLEEAERFLLEGVQQAERSGNEGALLYGYMGIANLRYAQKRFEACRERLQEVDRLLHRHTYPEIIAGIVAGSQINTYLKLDEIALAARVASERRLNEQRNVTNMDLLEYIPFAQLLLLQGHVEGAAALLHRMRGVAESEGYNGHLIRILLLQTHSLSLRGYKSDAAAHLAQALALAQPEGYIRTFLEAGAPIVPLLSTLLNARQAGRFASSVIMENYMKSLLRAFEAEGLLTGITQQTTGSSLNIATPLMPASTLSEREKEVLRLIAQGLSNQQIAQQLVVEMNTLKTHIKHLYQKLDVKSRTQAIARARDLNLT